MEEVTELQKLQDVFQFGFITEAEYKERKRAILLANNLPVDDEPTTQSTTSNGFGFSVEDTSQAASTNDFGFSANPFSIPQVDSSDDFGFSYDSFSIPQVDPSNDYNYKYPSTYDASSYSIETSEYSTNNINQADFNYNQQSVSIDDNVTQDLSYLEESSPLEEFHNEVPKNEDSALASFEQRFSKPLTTNLMPDWRVQRVYAPPNDNKISCLINGKNQHCDEYYIDDLQDKIIIYSNEKYGVFQYVTDANETLDSILKLLGVSCGSLLEVNSNNAPIYDRTAIVPPGQFKLIKSYTMIHRKWIMKIDRDSYDYKFDPLAHEIYAHNFFNLRKRRGDIFEKQLPVWKKTSICARHGYNPSAYNKHFSAIMVQNARELMKERRIETRETVPKCAFQGDTDPSKAIFHFLVRLRALEAKWTQTNEPLAIHKIKKSLAGRECYFCGEPVSTATPFCVKHSDELLNTMFINETVAQHFSNAVEREKVVELVNEWDTTPLAATQMYEKHIKKPNQYRYFDPSQTKMTSHASSATKSTMERLSASLNKQSL